MFKFRIEFYPRTGKYFVKYRWGYLRKEYFTGFVSTTYWGLSDGTSVGTEREAEELISLYKEQHFKESVLIRILPKFKNKV